MEQVIELTNVYRPFWMKALKVFFTRIFLPLVVAVLIFIACAQVTRVGEWGLAHLEVISIQVSNYFTKVKVVKELIPPSSIPLNSLIESVASKESVDGVVLSCLVSAESLDGTQQYRFEPRKYEERSRVDSKLPEGERRAMASSHGLAHVMGFNAEPECKIKWHQLYEPMSGLSCGAKIIRRNYGRHSSVTDSGHRLWLAFRDYNGTGADAENYANRAMACVGQKLFKGLMQ